MSFSRDGEWVAYVSYPEGTLWRSRVDGRDRLQLTIPPVFAAGPRWSPDSTQIAFMDFQTGRPWKILFISAQGGAAQEMLAENLTQLDPEWSPDGKQIVFGRRPLENSTIQLLDLNSKQVSMESAARYRPSGDQRGKYRPCEPGMIDWRKMVIFDFKKQTWSDWVTVPGGHGYPAWSQTDSP